MKKPAGVFCCAECSYVDRMEKGIENFYKIFIIIMIIVIDKYGKLWYIETTKEVTQIQGTKTINHFM